MSIGLSDKRYHFTHATYALFDSNSSETAPVDRLTALRSDPVVEARVVVVVVAVVLVVLLVEVVDVLSAVEDQVFDKVQFCPFIAPEAYKSLSSNSVGKRHPVLPLIVLVEQNEFASAQVSINEVGIQVRLLLATKLPAGAGATHKPFWRVAGEMQVRGSTVSVAWAELELKLPTAA
jgi:hypothetical protein